MVEESRGGGSKQAARDSSSSRGRGGGGRGKKGRGRGSRAPTSDKKQRSGDDDGGSRNSDEHGGRGSSPPSRGKGRGGGRGRGRGRGRRGGRGGRNSRGRGGRNSARGEASPNGQNESLNTSEPNTQEKETTAVEVAKTDGPKEKGSGNETARPTQTESQNSKGPAAASVEGQPSPEEKTAPTANGKPKPKKQRKKKAKKPKTPPPVEVEPEPEKTTTEALEALPAQEVSLTADVVVRVRKSTSVPNNLNEAASTKGLKATTGKKKKNRKGKGLSSDEKANRKAALQFNRSVRSCVDNSDPEALSELLRDKNNHNFALDAIVLETVLRAYVMAAMFGDALYCLRNCTLPATLSTTQAERILLCLPQNMRNASAYAASDMIDALCIATHFDVPTKRTYFLRIVRGIAQEFLEEAMTARDRICSAPCERLVRSAVCVVDARLHRGRKPADILVEPGKQLGIFVPDSAENRGIQAGDAVSILPYAGPYPLSAESLDRNMIEATVTNVNPMVLRLQDKTNASLHTMLTEKVDGNVYRIDKLANRMGLQRQLSAAVAITSPTDEVNSRSRPSKELIQAITAMDENINRAMRSGKVLQQSRDGIMTSTAEICSKPVPWSSTEDDGSHQDDGGDRIRDASMLALEKYGALRGLNASQRLAVEGAATNRLTLVQGPPGTGKTAVGIRILQHWARLATSEVGAGMPPNPILATSDSNIAVDNLVEGCANVGLRVIRLGRPEAIRPELLRFCIDRPSSDNRDGNNSGSYGGGGSHASAFREKIKQIRNAQVVCCTCIGSGGDILDNMVFERVLVDEATQATEPAVLVPLTRGCRQLVLVGDHCQLPPTVLSPRAQEEGLGVPLFSRMVACGVPPFMLDTQYRMHPAIAMFPSDLFYGGKLKNGVTAPERRPLAGFPWPREEFPVAFVPINGIEVDDGVSKLNEAEAAAAYDAVEELLNGGQCKVSDIAVVTPYAAQARLIRRMTRKLTPNPGPPFVEVSSTDGFQGREKEAVVFSAVRSNQRGAVGFVSDWRRVNVSFTRARRALIVIGNEQTLRRGDADTWMPWLSWADAHGLNMDRPGIPRGRYDPEQLRRVRGGTTAAEMLKDVLARQQKQLESAEKQLQKATRNAAGHIIAKEEEEAEEKEAATKAKSLEDDLAELANEDGNWDDSDESDDEPVGITHSVSQPTLTSTSPADENHDSNRPLDAWDL